MLITGKTEMEKGVDRNPLYFLLIFYIKLIKLIKNYKQFYTTIALKKNT